MKRLIYRAGAFLLRHRHRIFHAAVFTIALVEALAQDETAEPGSTPAARKPRRLKS